MKETDEQEILALIQNPISMEFGYRQLILVYQKRVYHIIRRMVLIHEDADDLTQNTFIKAYRYIDKFHGNSSLFTWLYRIATNEALSFL
jgi:RNA polymerase sigma factor (sigma-70 family)